MQKIVILLLLCGFTFTMQAQSYTTEKTASTKQRKDFEEAQGLAFHREYAKALKLAEKLISDDSKFIDAHILKAQILYDLEKLEEAVASFEQVLNLDANYNSNVLYMLAVTEYRQDKYEKAALHFEQYLATNPRNAERKTRAEGYLANAKFAAKALKNPVPFEPKRLSDNINTPDSESLPSLTADEETLVYTVYVNGKQEDLYFSRKVNGEWQKSQPLQGVNTDLNEGAQSISADGKFLVFTACNRKDGKGSCDLYFSEVRNGRWTTPANMGSPINTKNWESQPSISSDGRTLYFASNRPGGLGQKDIWVSHRQANGSWSQPENVGAPINTAGNEQSPFAHPDGQTLYFMSDGLPGMGSEDLYLARKQPDGKWGTPENLGYPINTKAAEGALIVSLDGKTGYFTSDRNNFDGKGASAFESEKSSRTTDIYSFELYPAARPQPVTYVKAKVTNAETGEILEAAQVEFVDLTSNKNQTSSLTDWDGEFLTVLPIGKNYALNVGKQGFVFHSENFALEETAAIHNPFVLEIALQPVPKVVATAESEEKEQPQPISKPIILKNIFFETASAKLRPESLTELNRLKQLLEENPTLRIQLNGHTDNVGSESDNQILSENRAKAVYNFLIENNIAAERLSYKGFGESQPIDTNDSPQGRQNNRRTEFVIIK